MGKKLGHQKKKTAKQADTGPPLPPHYLQYKGNFKKCAAIQIIFEYFELAELIKMQILSRRFYQYVIRGICPSVPLRETHDFTELMKRQVTRVMLFCKQSCFYELSPQTDYRWVSKPLRVVDPTTDFESCPSEWPKNVQISPNEWLFFGGGDPDT